MPVVPSRVPALVPSKETTLLIGAPKDVAGTKGLALRV